MDTVTPEPVAKLSPQLEETFYSQNKKESEMNSCAVKRVSLLSLGYKTVNMKETFDVSCISKNRDNLVSEPIKKLITLFLEENQNMSEQKWKDFCATLRHHPDGPLVLKVNSYASKNLEEFKSMAKDGGDHAFKKAKAHKGWFIVHDNKKSTTYKALRVFAFYSKEQTELDILATGQWDIVGYVERKMIFEPQKDIPFGKNILKAKERYRLDSIQNERTMVLISSLGEQLQPSVTYYPQLKKIVS